MTEKTTLLFLILFLTCGCTSSEKEGERDLAGKREMTGKKDTALQGDTLKNRIEGLYAWVDLMPGGPASFHITGRIILPQNETLKAGIFEVWQSGRQFYRFIPRIENLTGTAEIDSLNLSRSVFQFAPEERLNLIKDFSPDSLIILKIQYNTSSGEIKEIIDSIKVERVY